MAAKRPGRPTTTGSRSTPVVSFRLGTETFGRLRGFAERKRMSPSQAAKWIVGVYLSM